MFPPASPVVQTFLPGCLARTHRGLRDNNRRPECNHPQYRHIESASRIEASTRSRLLATAICHMSCASSVVRLFESDCKRANSGNDSSKLPGLLVRWPLGEELNSTHPVHRSNRVSALLNHRQPQAPASHHYLQSQRANPKPWCGIQCRAWLLLHQPPICRPVRNRLIGQRQRVTHRPLSASRKQCQRFVVIADHSSLRMCWRCSIICAGTMFLRLNCKQRDRTVAGSFCGSVVANKILRTGSSSVFSNALKL